MELTGRNIIGDKLSKESETAFFGENPTTGRKLEPAFFEASQEEINEAIQKANIAFQQYRKKTGN
jgi:2,5-dioxopentanoate dehydrogenase